MQKDRESQILSAAEYSGVSYLFGIFKALHSLHGQSLADRWLRLPNSNRIFRGVAPLA
jgi:hypothetical protein